MVIFLVIDVWNNSWALRIVIVVWLFARPSPTVRVIGGSFALYCVYTYCRVLVGSRAWPDADECTCSVKRLLCVCVPRTYPERHHMVNGAYLLWEEMLKRTEGGRYSPFSAWRGICLGSMSRNDALCCVCVFKIFFFIPMGSYVNETCRSYERSVYGRMFY